MELIDSSKDLSKSWFVSLARRNDGYDMDENNCISLELDTLLSPSR
jgi:hypothetical protein